MGAFFSALKPLEKAAAAGSLTETECESARTGLAAIVAAFGWMLPEAGESSGGGDVPDEIRQMAEARWQAKSDKNWAESDRLRDEITAAGWVVKDSKDGFELERA